MLQHVIRSPRPASYTACLLLGVIFFGSPTPSLAQDTSPGDGSQGPLRVFLDCSFFCDFDFLRTEITFADWVRERQDADVHVLVSTQTTGAGGTEYTLRFIGLRAFTGMDDELRFAAIPAQSSDQTRRAMARILKAGLVRYAVRTPVGEQIEISYTATQETGSIPAAAVRDPWRNWVFRTRLSGFFNGESSYNSMNLSGSVSANRTTEEWKTAISFNTSYSRSAFDLGDGNEAISERRNHNFNTLLVKSLTSHLSAGARASGTHSTFENRDLAKRIAPAIEYNFFPYDQSTRRQLTLQYSVGANRIDYIEETIYDRTAETLLDQTLQVALGLRQPWGSINTSLEGSHYFHDASKYRLELGGNVDLRLFKGLSLNIGGSASRIRDQLHIRKGDLSEEEILLRLKQIQTSFFYFGSLGLTYSFGSIYNTVVNPRFGGN